MALAKVCLGPGNKCCLLDSGSVELKTNDRVVLEKVYTLELTGSPEKWQLLLVPTQARMQSIISRIRIGGSHADVRTIDFDQADGDRSEMLITKVAAR